MHQFGLLPAAAAVVLVAYLVPVGLWVNGVLSSQGDGGQQDEEEDQVGEGGSIYDLVAQLTEPWWRKADRHQPLCLWNLSCCYDGCQVTVIILVLGAKYEKGAGFRQRNSLLLQLQVGHRSGPRADGNFRLHLLIIPYDLGETSN